MDEIYTLQEVADKLRVSIQSITMIVKSGKMKSILVGRQYRITETFLNEYLNGIYGDTPIVQTRAVNPSEKASRKQKSKNEQPFDKIAKLSSTEVEPELGANLFADISSLEEQFQPIELILKLKADGMKYPAIAEHLNSLGLKTKQGKDWSKATVENNVRKYKKETEDILQ